jgi:hypothetical protein
VRSHEPFIFAAASAGVNAAQADYSKIRTRKTGHAQNVVVELTTTTRCCVSSPDLIEFLIPQF